jgi:hypothetical protein
MAKRTSKKAMVIMKSDTDMPVEQAPDLWGEKLVTFFDEFEVGMDGVWYGKEMDLDDIDSYYFMSGYEMLSLFPGLSVAGSGRADTSRGLEQIIKTRRTIANFAHLYAAHGSFRYAMPQEGEPA